MEKLMEAKGMNGIIMAYDDRVIISRKGFKGFLFQGFTGDRTYFYKDINAVEYRKPTLMANGYIKILLAGSNETRTTTGFTGTTIQTLEDQNTIALRAFKKSTAEETEKLYNVIMDKISGAKSSNSNTVIVQSSNLDELKKLAELRDSGIIDEDEFKEQKAKLLNK